MKSYEILLLSFYLLVQHVNCQFVNGFGQQPSYGFGLPKFPTNFNEFGLQPNQQFINQNLQEGQPGNQKMSQSPQQGQSQLNTQDRSKYAQQPPQNAPFPPNFNQGPFLSNPGSFQQPSQNPYVNQQQQQNTQDRSKYAQQPQNAPSYSNQAPYWPNPGSFQQPWNGQYPPSSNQNPPYPNNGGSQIPDAANKISEPHPFPSPSGKRVIEQQGQNTPFSPYVNQPQQTAQNQLNYGNQPKQNPQYPPYFNQGPFWPNPFAVQPWNPSPKPYQPSFTDRPQIPETTSAIPKPFPLQSSSGKRLSEQICEQYSSQVITKKPASAPLLSRATIVAGSCTPSQGLIVGGVDASEAEFPHMAGIGFKDFNGKAEFFCGGSLISDRYVLTATHCKTNGGQEAKIVRLGHLNLKLEESHGQDIDIEKFVMHFGYNSASKKNDIAVIKLARVVIFSKYIRPACLSTASRFVPNRNFIATGWGYTDASRTEVSDILQKVVLKILENGHSACSQYDLDDTQICAGDVKGKKDTCQGDSGGPLQVVSENNKCIYEIVGITSFGGPLCAQRNAAGAYTRISSHLDWIEQQVWG